MNNKLLKFSKELNNLWTSQFGKIKKYNTQLARHNSFDLKFTDRKMLYLALFRSVTGYGCLIYFPNISVRDKNKIKMEQRKMMLNIISAYSTVSYTSSYVISGIITVDLQLEMINSEIKITKKKKTQWWSIEKTENNRSEAKISGEVQQEANVWTIT